MQTLEQIETVSLPDRFPAPRLARKDDPPIWPCGEFVTDGHIAVESGYWPGGGRREKWTTMQYCPLEPDKRIRTMIDELPDGCTPEIVPDKAIVDRDGNITHVTFDAGCVRLGIAIRYYLWITRKLGLTIHDNPDNHATNVNTRRTFSPYPVRNSGGEVVGLVMPYLVSEIRRGQVVPLV